MAQQPAAPALPNRPSPGLTRDCGGGRSGAIGRRLKRPVLFASLAVPGAGDRDAAVRVETGGPARRDQAGRVIFLDDAWAAELLPQLAAVDDVCVEPAAFRPEIGAPARFGYRDIGREACRDGRGGARLFRNTAPDNLEADQFDGLVDPGAMAVGTLVLGPERLFERCQRAGVEPARRERHAQLEGLPLVMQASGAPDLDPLGREPVRS